MRPAGDPAALFQEELSNALGIVLETVDDETSSTQVDRVPWGWCTQCGAAHEQGLHDEQRDR